MPYNFGPQPIQSYLSGLNALKEDERQEKDRQRLLTERIDRVRKEAELLGVPKADVQASSVGELEAHIADRKRKEEERQRLAGRMMLERDQRAVVAAGQKFGSLSPSQIQYFMNNTGAPSTNDAAAVWDKMGTADRAMAFGVRDERLINKLMQDDQAVARLNASEAERKRKADEAAARLNASEAERKRKADEAAAGAKRIGTAVELPDGNKGVWTSPSQVQVLPKDKAPKYKKETYQGDFVRTAEGTVQEWNPTKEVYTPVKPDPVTVELVWDKDKKDFVKKPVEKDRWQGVQMRTKLREFDSLDEANAAKLPKGTPIIVVNPKTGRKEEALVQ
jgi:hypothetical protein